MKLAVKFWQNVKKANRNFLPVLLSLVLLTTAAAANTSNGTEGANINASGNTVTPGSSFKRVWIDYNITQGGIKGMRVHANFEVYNMKGIPGYLALYFQERDGTPLMDNNDKFVSADDTVMAYFAITPQYNPTTVYEDLTIFMPYDELDLPDGKYELRVEASIIYSAGGRIGSPFYYNVDYSQGNPVTVPTKGSASATLDKVWVDYDVTQGGLKGMLVHVKFTVNNMKGISSRLAIYFQRKGGGKLITSNRLFRSNDGDRSGELVANFTMNPGYPTTVYEDAKVFLPYKELNAVLASGDHDLQMDIDVVYSDGTFIEHLETEEFFFSRP